MDAIIIYRGQCHCGNVQFEVTTVLDRGDRCNCSFCLRRSAIMHSVTADRFSCWLVKILSLFTSPHANCKTLLLQRLRHLHVPPPAHCPNKDRVNVACLENADLANLNVGFVNGRAYD